MSWLWPSSTSASGSTVTVPVEKVATEAESSTTASKRAGHVQPSTAYSAPTATAPVLDTSEAETNTSGPSGSSIRYQRILRDEEKYQAKQYPNFEEVPGCMQLFDEFMMCYALVPQLRSFYRRGDFHDCTWKFKDFKYCLSLKSEPEDRRVQLWTKRRAEWWANRRYEGSSEDVWDLRDKPPANFPPVYSEEEHIAEQADVKIVS